MNVSLKVLPLLLASSVLIAQNPQAPSPDGGLNPGQSIVGAVVGFGSIGSATAAFGGRYELAIKALPNLGNGILGFSLDADFYHYSDALNSGVGVTYIPIGASVNYHFHVDDRRWDPFLGGGLGYSIANASGSAGSATASSTAYIITRAGVRYFYSQNMALQADAGAGAAAFNVGVVWKM